MLALLRIRLADEELVPLLRDRGDAWREWGEQLGPADSQGKRTDLGPVTGSHKSPTAADRKSVERARKLAAVDDDDYQQWREAATLGWVLGAPSVHAHQ